MITLQQFGSISPIYLTIALIVYLIIVELGNEKIKKALMPVIISLIVIFLIVAVLSVVATYSKLP